MQVTKAFKNGIPNAFLPGLEDWFGEGKEKACPEKAAQRNVWYSLALHKHFCGDWEEGRDLSEAQLTWNVVNYNTKS